VQAPLQPIARNLRRWRQARDISLSALAEQAGVSKSTVSLIERGQGNPSIDTISSLASALNVPFAALLTEEATSAKVAVVRAQEASVAAAERGEEEGEMVVKRMLTRPRPGSVEIYTLRLEQGAVRRANGHVSGLVEHVVVCSGTVEIAGAGFSEILGAGDMISFKADEPHSYAVLQGPVKLVSIHEHPRRLSA